MTLTPGTRLGPYEITALLGAGGMGEVWRAVDGRLGREVAIKVLPDGVAGDHERVARFAREAKLLASLRHSGIATIHAFEEVDGKKLLVMEIAEGEGLDERIARGPIALEDAIPIARQIAEALEEAHEQGIVHRDLKPANVKVRGDGRVKLLDFGLAKALSADAPGAAGPALSMSPTIEASPTVAGVILGTAPYMAPEQARGRAVDRRADIWAFGAVLCEMLTGKRLFTGGSVADVLANVLKQPIALDALPRETPLPVRRLLERCLERDPRKRLRDAGEARIALEDASALEPETAARAKQAPPRSSRARLAQIAAIVMVAATLGALAAWLARPAPRRPSVRAVSFPMERLTETAGATAAVSPDGTRVLYVAESRVHVQSLTDPIAEPLDISPVMTGPSLSEIAFWSFDGANVAVAMEHKLWRVPAGGGTPSLLCGIPESGVILGGDWAADDQIVFAVWRGNLYRVPGGGGRPEELLRRDPKTEVDFHCPRLLPDGRGVLFVAHRFTEEPHELSVLAGGRREKVLNDGSPIAQPFYAEGHILYAHNRREGIWAVPFSLGTLTTTGRPRLALGDGTSPSLATDGTLVFVRGVAAPVGELVWVGPGGETGTRVSSPLQGLREPVLSPDEKRVAFSFRSDQHDDLAVIDILRGTQTRLTSTPDRDEEFPTWTSTGVRILYGQGFRMVLRSVGSSGAAEPRDIGSSPTIRAQLEADGRHLVTMTDLGGGSTMLLRTSVDADMRPDGAPVEISRTAIWWSRLAVAPQGDLIAYAALQGERTEIFLSQLGGEGRWQVSSSSSQQPCWSRKGDRLFYLAGDDMMEVEVRRGTSLSLSAPRRLFSLGEHRLQSGGFDVASDGRFLMVRRGAPPRIVVVVNGRSLLAPDGR